MAMKTSGILVVVLCAACGGMQAKRMVVPDGMRREPQALPLPENRPATPELQGALQPASATAALQSALQPASSNTSRTIDGRYVLRLAEHNRVWELQLPESAGGYEMRIPLDGPLESPTAADAEMFAAAKDAAPAARPFADAKPDGAPKAAAGAKTSVAAKADAGEKADAGAKPLRKGYLGTLAKVREMYGSRRYELALVELVDLEASHPKDARLQAMKGSVYLKLGRPQLAKESWQKALALDPEDIAVAEALRALKEE